MTIGSNDWEGLSLAGGRYLITAKLGEGGMGFVYRAIDQNIESEVVIKIPRQAMMDDPEFAGRFTREIRSLVKLSHPHIVKVTDVGTWEGTPFAVMQYLAGRKPRGSAADRTRADRFCHVTRRKRLSLAHRGRRGARLHPRSGLRPPRRQAGQHPLRRPRARVPERFRRRQGAGFVDERRPQSDRDDRRRNGAGHARIHGTRADHGRAVRRPRRSIRPGGHRLRDALRPPAVRGRDQDEGARPCTPRKPPPALTEWCPALPERLSQAVLKGLAKDPDGAMPLASSSRRQSRQQPKALLPAMTACG